MFLDERLGLVVDVVHFGCEHLYTCMVENRGWHRRKPWLNTHPTLTSRLEAHSVYLINHDMLVAWKQGYCIVPLPIRLGAVLEQHWQK